jgi:hypothetical protein
MARPRIGVGDDVLIRGADVVGRVVERHPGGRLVVVITSTYASGTRRVRAADLERL